MLKKIQLLILLLIFPLLLKAQSTRVLFKTDYGKFIVMLYDFTPVHKQLFLQHIKNGTYRNALINRIVKDFVVQGGEHDIAIASKEKAQGYLEPRIPPEFDERAYHKIGALGAGRDDNPQKASFINQIYFVVGKKYSEEAFDSLAHKYNKTFTPERRAYYIQHGGLPRLDDDYTVFGEIVEGMDVLMKISQLPVDAQHFPLKKVKFKVKILK
jgi:cyclophilin family peptidyl-prolyl cis-trans isomerase